MPAARSRFLILSAIALIAVSLSAAAQARHHHRHRADDRGYQDRVEPNSDAAQDATRGAGSPAQANGLGPAVAQIIRVCDAQAEELKIMPFDAVVETVQPNADQRGALDQIRAAAADAVNKLNATCPRVVPPRLTDRLDTMRTSLDAIKAALVPLRPVFVTAYAGLDDEQKARLVALAISRQPAPAQQDASHSGKAAAAAHAGDNQAQPASLDCRQWPMVLKNWPLQRIESTLSLSDDQHAALYTLMAAIYRGAAGLAASCHDENPLTPVGRLDAELRRVNALREYVDAIGTALNGFANSLSDEQAAQLNAVLGVAPRPEAAPALVSTSLHRRRKQE
jgi:hypothetical protein